eukprot:scaffold7490_cov103-Alexandrium_tamarense.AAC.1
MNEEHDFRCRRPILRRSMKRRLDHISCDDSPVNPAHLKRRKVVDFRCRRPILRRSMKRRLDHISCDDSP